VTEHKVIGKILGNRYRILREVGSGGMAWVYLAEDINEGRLVAVKVLYPQFNEDLAYIQRFNREAKLASTLSDQHIVRVLDYGATRDVHYLVMEYIEGQDLRSIIDERSSLPWREAMQILDQVAVALEHAHLHGIVHRDIKPQNLMMTGDGVLKVLDFGIARVRKLPSLTQSGFVGSPYYISPEQAMGEDVDIRSDIYSAGVVLYEMLSGRVPYDAASPWSIISQHIASEPPRIDLRDGDVPESSEMLVRRMIAKRPEDRFQTPTALRQTIECVLEGRSLPKPLDIQAPALPDPVATAEGLHQRALQAIEEEDWQRAVDLLNQVTKLNPDHKEASEKLAYAGRQARLAALYTAARRAMESGRWQEAMDELSEVLSAEPNYRDATDLLEQARTARQDEDVAQAVSDLYDRGVDYIEAGAWVEAAQCLRQVQQLSPGYKKTQSLLAEAERHIKSRSGRLFGERGVSHRVVLPVALGLILLALALGAYFFIIQNSRASVAPELATRVSENPTQVYGEAQQAFQDGDWDKAIELFDAVLANERNYQDAAALRKQSIANRALEQSFEEGETAYMEGDWDRAINVLSRLRRTDATFRKDETQAMLCDAYLQRGQVKVDSQANPSNTHPIESALKDFEAGLAICPDNETLSDQQTYAKKYLSAVKAQKSEDFDTMVQELGPVIDANPDYANDHARQVLYTGLVERGDIRQQSGNLNGALADYQQALTLDDTDSLDAASRLDAVLRELGGERPPTPLTDGTPTRPAYKYAAPTLIGPPNDALFRGEYTIITLEWEPVGALAEDEYYDVTVMHFVGEEPHYWGGPVRETQWQVPDEVGLGEAANDRFYWWVTVRKANTAPNPDQLDLPLSPRSDALIFYWAE
jgi:tetratricopeptide (TPR) repeat protein/predicted Ser/Thr protein kinase